MSALHGYPRAFSDEGQGPACKIIAWPGPDLPAASSRGMVRGLSATASIVDPEFPVPEPWSGHFVVLRGISWDRYLALAEDLEGTGARLTYLDGILELMPPPLSDEHEGRSFHIGHFIAEFCLHARLPFWGRGSRTLRFAKEAGVEPDEQFTFRENKDTPDLVVEVAFSSGGLSKLSVYERFRIAEVWIWQGDALRVHVLDPETDRYEARSTSSVLPGIDLPALARCARIDESGAAIREFRESLR